MSKKEKVGFIRRIGNYGSRRVVPDSVADQAKKNATGSVRVALDALRPNHIDPDELRAGYEGRYSDGGKNRFEVMVAQNDLDEHQLDRMSEHNHKIALAFLLGGVIGLVFGFYMMFTEDMMLMIFAGAATCIVGLTLFATSLRFEYISWQIANRRFGGFREFLERWI